MLEILHQNDDFCIINKPANSVVYRTRGAEHLPALLQSLRDQLGKYLYPVHRLDAGTSGCLFFAFSSESAKKLQATLQSESTTKKYTALCLDHLEPSGEFNRPLSNDKKIKQKALTKFKTIETFLTPTNEKYSLLELEIKTGRRHQIRRHLSHEGKHIIGDVNYGKGWLNKRFRENYNFRRMFLHCNFVSITHPTSKGQLSVICELEQDLKDLTDKLRST